MGKCHVRKSHFQMKLERGVGLRETRMEMKTLSGKGEKYMEAYTLEKIHGFGVPEGMSVVAGAEKAKELRG